MIPQHKVVEFNDMFSMTPTTPIFELFGKMIPYRCWYMYGADSACQKERGNLIHPQKTPAKSILQGTDTA